MIEEKVERFIPAAAEIGEVQHNVGQCKQHGADCHNDHGLFLCYKSGENGNNSRQRKEDNIGKHDFSVFAVMHFHHICRKYGCAGYCNGYRNTYQHPPPLKSVVVNDRAGIKYMTDKKKTGIPL